MRVSWPLTAKILKFFLCDYIATVVFLMLQLRRCDGLQISCTSPKNCAAICSELDEHLAGVLPTEQADKGFWCLLQPVFHGFATLDGA